MQPISVQRELSAGHWWQHAGGNKDVARRTVIGQQVTISKMALLTRLHISPRATSTRDHFSTRIVQQQTIAAADNYSS
jgi:hypothetical protein